MATKKNVKKETGKVAELTDFSRSAAMSFLAHAITKVGTNRLGGSKVDIGETIADIAGALQELGFVVDASSGGFGKPAYITATFEIGE